MSRPLTARARAFADAYAGPVTGGAAAVSAGYGGGPGGARVRAHELLRDPRVQERIAVVSAARSLAPDLRLEHLRTPHDVRFAALTCRHPDRAGMWRSESEDYLRGFFDAVVGR